MPTHQFQMSLGSFGRRGYSRKQCGCCKRRFDYTLNKCSAHVKLGKPRGHKRENRKFEQSEVQEKHEASAALHGIQQTKNSPEAACFPFLIPREHSISLEKEKENKRKLKYFAEPNDTSNKSQRSPHPDLEQLSFIKNHTSTASRPFLDFATMAQPVNPSLPLHQFQPSSDPTFFGVETGQLQMLFRCGCCRDFLFGNKFESYDCIHMDENGGQCTAKRCEGCATHCAKVTRCSGVRTKEDGYLSCRRVQESARANNVHPSAVVENRMYASWHPESRSWIMLKEHVFPVWHLRMLQGPKLCECGKIGCCDCPSGKEEA
ncbi:hypothetical protein BJ508DRAFT_313447 [Ascobolus immersus RN42]|uniref:Uncharacterized protein n=1 Tax=Ascobolus immersus RN42 TaxID=1160509 RepID=A0A3N4HIU8_ASCIM|nr:hypothetical protein BJ508DRAFT_313447 [Ascobolus immersus RN42]